MATITITASGLTARSKTISTAHTTRLLAAYRVRYGQVSDGAGGMRDMTDQEVFNAFADGLFRGMIGVVRSAEDEVAVRTAKAGVSDIILT